MNEHRTRILAITGAALLGSLWFGEVRAQPRCAEGITRDGRCVDPRLAERARQAAIIFSQPKISATAYPVLPSGDAGYRYPHELTIDPLRIGAAGMPLPPSLPPAAPPAGAPPSSPSATPPSASGGSNPTGAAVIF